MPRYRERVVWEGSCAPLEDLLRGLAPAERPVFLRAGAHTILAWSPDRVLEGRVRPQARKGSRARPWPRGAAAAFEAACSRMDEEDWIPADPQAPAGCGWYGHLGFEAGHLFEAWPWVPPGGVWLPDLCLGRYRQAVLREDGGRARLLVAVPDPRPARERWEKLRRRPVAPPVPVEPLLKAQGSRRAWIEAVRRLQEWIAAGELYQANLARFFEGESPDDPAGLFRHLLHRCRPAHAAFWRDGRGRALLSCSPELFLEVRGDLLETRPIKGTAPRRSDPGADATERRQLETSSKERAELTMIVDMARNDLGRVACPGSVAVPDPGSVRSLPGVHHREAVVRARWDPGRGLRRLLAASFPPASVTGAPKIRALEAIATLEGRARGAFCGSFLYWRPGAEARGRATVLIRTLEAAGRRLRLGVGAGIVWDSEAGREWEETLWKAASLFPALRGEEALA